MFKEAFIDDAVIFVSDNNIGSKIGGQVVGSG